MEILEVLILSITFQTIACCITAMNIAYSPNKLSNYVFGIVLVLMDSRRITTALGLFADKRREAYAAEAPEWIALVISALLLCYALQILKGK